jgi:hypothetical protein
MCLNETYNKVVISKYLSVMFPIYNGLKQRDVSLQLLFSFTSEYVIGKVQENQVEVKGTSLAGLC